jgi:hypothetical protein
VRDNFVRRFSERDIIVFVFVAAATSKSHVRARENLSKSWIGLSPVGARERV